MTKSDSNTLLHLYNDEEIAKIYSLKEDENELQESDSFEWCPTWSSGKVPQVASLEDLETNAQGSPNVGEEPPDELPGFQGVNWPRGHLGVDLRPHIYDPNMKEFLLCDSGSQITAVPPEPGDKVVPGLVLRAVNGSRIECFGYKMIEVKIGRKTYPFKAIKALVDSTVLGWDFFRRHRLDLIWNDWGDVCLYDRRAKITQVLSYKSIPFQKSVRHEKLCVLNLNSDAANGTENRVFEVAAMQKLAQEAAEIHKEDIDKIPDSDYKEILRKFPELLEQSFDDDHTKNKITHRILTGEAKPCRAKVRRLLPGSPKAIQAEKDFLELERLGIIERVNPEDANTWSSPIHFVDKGDGTLRPVGDYRLLNDKTELDLYNLPHLRDFQHLIADEPQIEKTTNATRVGRGKKWSVICLLP